jgi:hypothetical protein
MIQLVLKCLRNLSGNIDLTIKVRQRLVRKLSQEEEALKHNIAAALSGDRRQIVCNDFCIQLLEELDVETSDGKSRFEGSNIESSQIPYYGFEEQFRKDTRRGGCLPWAKEFNAEIGKVKLSKKLRIEVRAGFGTE